MTDARERERIRDLSANSHAHACESDRGIQKTTNREGMKNIYLGKLHALRKRLQRKDSINSLLPGFFSLFSRCFSLEVLS